MYHIQYIHIPGVLITGGARYQDSVWAMHSTELYLPSSNTSCLLPSLPDARTGHTSSPDGLLCGGPEQYWGCVKWQYMPMLDTWTWQNMDLTLDFDRQDHVAWTPASGIGTYLMGGCGSRTTTLIKPDGTQEHGFALKYRVE